MSDVFWKRSKPDPDGTVWNDLRDRKVKDWIVTYREAGTRWLVMHRNNYRSMDSNPDLADRYIDKADITEEQLRNDLRLHYILTRGET
jgi:hypothetical protein